MLGSLLFLAALRGPEQVAVARLDVRAALSTGSGTLQAQPAPAGGTSNLFDGNPVSYVKFPDGTARLTLAWSDAHALARLAVRPRGVELEWWAEGADTETDLSSRTGTYVLLSAPRRAPPGRLDEAGSPSDAREILSMTFRRTDTGTEILLDDIEVWERARLDRLDVLPDHVFLSPGGTFRLVTRGHDQARGLAYDRLEGVQRLASGPLRLGPEEGRIDGLERGEGAVETRLGSLETTVGVSILGGRYDEPTRLYVPGVAEARGLAGALFSSTLWLLNPSDEPTRLTLELLPFEGRDPPGPFERVLEGGAALALPAVLRQLGAEGAAGTLVVSSDRRVLVRAVTENAADPGARFGASLPVLGEGHALTPGRTAHLVGLRQGAGFRSNVLLTALTALARVRLDVLDEAGARLGGTTVELAGPVSWQRSLAELGATDVALGRVEVSVLAGAALGTASVVDGSTNDAVTVVAEVPRERPADLDVPAVVETPGSRGSFWRTELVLANPSDRPADATLTAGGRTVTRRLPPGGSWRAGSALLDLGLPPAETGGRALDLTIRSASPVLASARTFNAGVSGAAQPVERPISRLRAGGRGALLPLLPSGSSRTNVAFRAGPSGSHAALSLRGEDGRTLAAARLELAAGAYQQDTSASLFGLEPAGLAWIDVHVESGELTGWLSRVDGGSGDPVVLPLEAIPLVVKRALAVTWDPVIEADGGRPLHEVAGWNDPRWLNARYLAALEEESGGRIAFQLVESLYLDGWPLAAGTFQFRDDTYLEALRAGAWPSLGFGDYAALADAFALDEAVGSGRIHEVVLWAPPHWGGPSYESRMLGATPYWCNAPPLVRPGTPNHVVMTFNYERQLGEALHSFSHRAESILTQAFGSWFVAGGREDHLWDRVSYYERAAAGRSGLGNVHNPPNARADYDYENPAAALSGWDSWALYPSPPVASREVSGEDWGFSHEGFLREWLSRLPRAEGRESGGRLRDFWAYLVDFGAYPETDGSGPAVLSQDGSPCRAALEPFGAWRVRSSSPRP